MEKENATIKLSSSRFIPLQQLSIILVAVVGVGLVDGAIGGSAISSKVTESRADRLIWIFLAFGLTRLGI
jgi:hypothetical protein